MFSENHHKVLQEITSGFSNTQILADKIGLPASLIAHLLEELSEYEFIMAVRVLRKGNVEVEDAYLINKGKAAVDSPEYFLGKPMNHQNSNNWYGDRIAGDKFTGDKVMGNKVQIGTVQGDAVAGNKTVNSQNLNQAAQDIKALLDQLTIDYPNDDTYTQAGRAIGAIKNNPTLKQRVGNAIKESGVTAVEKAIEAVTGNPLAGVIIAGVKGFIDA
jgi:hypothetical protein